MHLVILPVDVPAALVGVLYHRGVCCKRALSLVACWQSCKRILGLSVRSRAGGKLCVECKGRCGLRALFSRLYLTEACVAQSLKQLRSTA